MSSAFVEFHDELRAATRQVLARAPRQDGGTVPAWPDVVTAGWLGLEVPSALGGAGATVAETAVVLQELGRAAGMSTSVTAAALGVGALAEAASTSGCDRLLGEVADGRTRVAVAVPAGDEDPTDVAFNLHEDGAAVRLTGHASYVLGAPDADRLLVVARAGAGAVLVAVDPSTPGLTVVAQPVVDPTRRLGSVAASGAVVGLESVWHLAEPWSRSYGRLRDRAALAIACDSFGIAEAMLDATVAYASVREQFGRPIGSFQAVQHACADMLVQVSLSRELLAHAITRSATDDPEGWVAVSMAKAYVTTAALGIAGKAMQLHGGIGYTWESGIHTFLKRAALNRSLFGSPTWHRRRLGRRYGEGARDSGGGSGRDPGGSRIGSDE